MSHARFGPGGRWAAIAVVTALLIALAGASGAEPVPTPPGAPRMVRMLAVESAPPINDTRVRSFLTGFRGTFLDESFVTERSAAREGEYALSVPITNRFVLLMGSGTGDSSDAWQAQVTMQWILSPRDSAALRDSIGGLSARGAKPRRAASARHVAESPARSGVVVTYWSLSPEAVAANTRPLPKHERVQFLFPSDPGSAFYREAGRCIAMLVLEDLHHQSGDLDPDERLRLADCIRTAP